ncbi:MAG: hypothetical protein R6V49_07505 [Bacteroidales bacterium]
MNNYFTEDGHPDIIDLALVADYLFAGGSLRGEGKTAPESLKEVMNHIEVCQQCRETVMDIHDTIIEVEQMSVKPWEEESKHRFKRWVRRLWVLPGKIPKMPGIRKIRRR